MKANDEQDVSMQCPISGHENEWSEDPSESYNYGSVKSDHSDEFESDKNDVWENEDFDREDLIESLNEIWIRRIRWIGKRIERVETFAIDNRRKVTMNQLKSVT